MLNALSIDVEDYFHVEAFAGEVSPEDWPAFTSRVEGNVERILEMLEKFRCRATFFILGWVAERFPLLVQSIDRSGHEIACHGFAHQHIRRQSPDQFRRDVRRARRYLMEIAQKPVDCYRAPSFSITRNTLWALKILREEGFRIDSSIFPIRHDLYGIPDYERFPHWRDGIFEFPPATIRRMHTNFGVAGGGYLRLLPYRMTNRAIRNINEKEGQPAMIYFHPWEIDPHQPRIHAPMRSRLRHYTNLSRMQDKIGRLLRDFRFSTVSEVCNLLPIYHSGKVPQ